jgi:serine/threonine-protein kinase PknG
MLGLGMVEVPRVPYRDPSAAVLSNPEVSENKRFCGKCGQPVGRVRPGRPARTEGFCPHDGTPYSFTPKLRKGDLVGGQYEVLGCLAHGGLGWIYLGRDRNVSDRWVVLKGLLDTKDPDKKAVAKAEGTFLAAVEHPNIVKIHNFVQHERDDYIVMEYVGGRSLRDILEQRRRDAGPTTSLPLPQVIAYGLEILRAFGYLHAQGMLYCDFKPDNAIQSEEQLKLIDLGAVRKIDDEDSAIYGTIGYQAPEIAKDGPSISSDLYTVGRALAVLGFPFKGFASTYVDGLPPRESVPLLATYTSFDRLLRRATNRDPALRFQSAAEMAEQLTGVLREVLSAEDGRPRPAPSALFGPERFTSGPAIVDMVTRADGPVLGTLTAAAAVTALPVPLVDGADPAAGYLAGLTALEDEQLAAALAAAPTKSPEVELALARVRIVLGDLTEAGRLLDGLAEVRPADWRVSWYRALAALAAGDDEGLESAARLFDRLYSTLPGEAAPKLVLAYCRELRGDLAGAGRMYEVVWRTDNGYLSAGFGLARARFAGGGQAGDQAGDRAGDRAGAIRALDSVPQISSHHAAAQAGAVAMTVRGRAPAELTELDLLGAAARLEGLGLDGGRYERLAAEVLEAALGWLAGGARAGARLLGAELTERPLRRRLEDTYRTLARHAGGKGDRVALIGRANAVRPRTLF